MNQALKPPHDFGTAAAQMLLPVLPEEIKGNTERFLAGKLDGNLAVIFNSLSRQTMELACLKLFFTPVPLDEILDLLGQSALAQANKFRLLGDGKSPRATITWADRAREIPAQPAMDMHNSLGIAGALVNATLADRPQDLAFLAGIPRRNMQHPGIQQHEQTLVFTSYLQSLFGGTPAPCDPAALETRMLDLYTDNTADSAYIRAYVKGYIALGSPAGHAALPDLLENLLAAHRTLFDSERDNRRWAVPGLICFHGLGICALARRIGLNIVCDNPYLPQPLLARINGGRG